MSRKFFGVTPCGGEAHIYTLKNEKAEATITDYGATLLSLKIDGVDVIGGFDRLEDYFTDDSHQGAIIGRVANRIEGACFTMDGKEYNLPANNGRNCLHGGRGFDFRLWSADEYNDNNITFTYTAKDGEEGFPAKLDVTVRYILDGSDLIIDYKAIPDGTTPIALTNHAYFNLNGLGKDILTHKLTLFADRYTTVNDELIPTGERPLVDGTAFDFRAAKAIGKDIGNVEGGYDHNYILTPEIANEYIGKELGLIAILEGDALRMKMYTDQPGVQLYTGNFLGNGHDFKGGIKQVKHGALCLEAQTEPNAVKRGECFYKAGEEYVQTTVYSFEKM